MTDGPVRRQAAIAHSSPTASTAVPVVRETAVSRRPGDRLLELQRSRGNRYVQRLLAATPAGPIPVMARRAVVGAADSPLERQAEQVATRIAGPGAARSPQHLHPSQDAVHRPGAGAAGAEGGVADPPVERGISRARGGGRPLPATIRATMEQAFGADLGAVRLHAGAGARELSRSIGAEAFTTGHDIFLGPGHDLTRPSGHHLLAHELTHVLQQNPAGSVHRRFGDDHPDPSPLTAHALDRLRAIWGSSSPEKVHRRLTKRFPEGPIIGHTELLHIERISSQAATDINASDWLEVTGLGDMTTALHYVSGHDFRRWLKLDPARRVFYASLAYDRGIGANDPNPPPTYTLGRHMAIKSESLLPATRAAAKSARDATIRNAYVETLMPADPNLVGHRPAAEQAQAARSSEILTKIFLILQRSLKVYNGGNQNAHLPSPEDVARALAHGGRVNIRIPALKKGQNPHALTDWIGITDAGQRDDAVTGRAFGTHHMEITDNKKRTGRPDKRGKFIERGGKGAALSNNTGGSVFLYGMNVAGGGYGRADFNLGTISPDGAHGHMFLGFTPPTRKRDGALQVGMETTEPHQKSLVGYKHNWNSTEATANPESSFYGHKRGKVGGGGMDKNERLVDLKDLEIGGRNWRTELMYFESQWKAALAAAQAAGNERGAYQSLVGTQAARGW